MNSMKTKTSNIIKLSYFDKLSMTALFSNIKFVIAFIIILSNYQIIKLNAQTLKPFVIATAGGYASNTNGSLSFTIGETVTPTFQNGNTILTHGFQQPFQLNLNLKAYLQGYYLNTTGLMENVLYNQGVTAFAGTECDTIQIQLREANAPYNIAYTTSKVIPTNGQISLNGLSQIGQSYYIVIKHRNTVETWSANPVTMNEITSYDFTAAANKAFGNNQIEVNPGVWAFYSGDINQDENVDLLDLSTLETDVSNFAFGYFATDINGDGNVDLLDSPVMETNINGFVFSNHP